MRSILAVGMVVAGLNGAAYEPDYTSFLNNPYNRGATNTFHSLVEIDSDIGRGDRLTVATLRTGVASGESHDVDAAQSLLSPAILSTTEDETLTGTVDTTDRPAQASVASLCNALLTSAQENDLPVPFFANLIWQESRLRDDAVSRVGALGIAQFMPEVAMEKGLNDPFDPLQAIPASAKLLRELRQQFGNLGFVAAAYNAGAHRVAEWLERRRGLPRETRGYVVNVTGRSVEQWRNTPPHDGALTFVRRLPCRDMPAFADLEQAQLEQAQLERSENPPPQQAPAKTQQPSKGAAVKSHDAHPHHPAEAEDKHSHDHHEREAIHGGDRHGHDAERTASDHHRHGGDKRQADVTPHSSREKHGSA